jgi:hypothetical protein
MIAALLQCGCIGVQGAQAPLFPFEEEEDAVMWDEYGAAIDPQDFKLSEEVLGALHHLLPG